MDVTTTRHSQAYRAWVEFLRSFNKRTLNRLTTRFAGKRVYALLHHRGRKSDTPYQTPVVAMPSGESFVFPLPYGQATDWCRNVLSAGTCRITLSGREYLLEIPRIIPPQEALPAFPRWLHPLLRHTEVYLKMDRAGLPELPAGRAIRRILVYGAGVLGSLYAGKLHQAGYDVTLLARGKRLEELKERGLLLIEAGSDHLERLSLPVTDRLAPEDAYDLVLVILRKNQLKAILPALAANTHTPNVLFMVNNAEGPAPLVQALGAQRVLLGFPGAGGQRVNGVVRYLRMSRGLQATTIGELGGSHSLRIAHIALALQDAGFGVAVSPRMDAWLKTHAAVVSPVANALYLAGGSNYRLARTQDGLLLMLRAVKEGLRVLRALQVPITPARYRLLSWLPEPLLLAMLRAGFNTPQAELALARHANAARDEMATIAGELRVLARRSGAATPASDALYCYLNPAFPTLPEGQTSLQVDWRSAAVWTVGLLSAGAILVWRLAQRGKRH